MTSRFQVTRRMLRTARWAEAILSSCPTRVRGAGRMQVQVLATRMRRARASFVEYNGGQRRRRVANIARHLRFASQAQTTQSLVLASVRRRRLTGRGGDVDYSRRSGNANAGALEAPQTVDDRLFSAPTPSS